MNELSLNVRHVVIFLFVVHLKNVLYILKVYFLVIQTWILSSSPSPLSSHLITSAFHSKNTSDVVIMPHKLCSRFVVGLNMHVELWKSVYV